MVENIHLTQYKSVFGQTFVLVAGYKIYKVHKEELFQSPDTHTHPNLWS